MFKFLKEFSRKYLLIICTNQPDVKRGLQTKKFDSFINWIIELRKDVKIPHKLSDVLEIDKVNLDKLSQMALEDPSTAGNPKKLTKEDMKIMYEHSLAGKLF